MKARAVFYPRGSPSRCLDADAQVSRGTAPDTRKRRGSSREGTSPYARRPRGLVWSALGCRRGGVAGAVFQVRNLNQVSRLSQRLFCRDLREHSRPPPTPRQPLARQQQPGHPAQTGRRVSLAPTSTVPVVSRPLLLIFSVPFFTAAVRKLLQDLPKKTSTIPCGAKTRARDFNSTSGLSHWRNPPLDRHIQRGQRERGGEHLLHAAPVALRASWLLSVLSVAALLSLSFRARWFFSKMQPSREETVLGGIPPKLLSNFLKNGEGC